MSSPAFCIGIYHGVNPTPSYPATVYLNRGLARNSFNNPMNDAPTVISTSILISSSTSELSYLRGPTANPTNISGYMNSIQNMNTNRCDYAKKCGGCRFINESYQKSLEYKQDYICKLLKQFGRIEDIIGMEQPYFYRNKVNATFGRDRKGNIISGQYMENTHKIIDKNRCLIEDEYADEIIAYIKSVLKSFKITVFDDRTKYGLLRHVLVRTAHETGEVMVVLVLNSPVLPSKNNFVKALVKKFDRIKTVVINVNDRQTSMVLGKRNINIYGKGYIEDILCGKCFRISPTSFYQINSMQTEILYGKAIEFAGLTGKESVFDAYSGIGTIGICASDHAKNVYCVELNPEAVRDAKENGKRNGVKNVRFVCDDAGKFMVKMAQDKEKVDVLFLDPPRSGSTNIFIRQVSVLRPRKIVYVSCGPESLARDLKMFQKIGYQVKKIQPVDMFPFTEREHVETVCLLSRKAQV